MASRGQHLDITEGREIVYCHGCRHEWYRDEHPDSLSCPSCQGDFTEIVSLENDPRNVGDDNGESDGDDDHGYRRHIHHHDSDSDPDEGDIEEHVFHGPGFFGRSTVHRPPEGLAFGRRPRVQGSSDDIIRRFTEMIGDMGGPDTAGHSGPGPENLFHDEAGGPRVTYRTFRGPGFTGGVSSFTITTGPNAGRVARSSGIMNGSASAPQAGADDPFQRIFGEILGTLGAPPMHDDPSRDDNAGLDGGAGNRPVDIATALNQLLASIVNPNAVHGDAVYSQEALDRIITNLMEANPQSNAPPPATEDAIASLPKKKLDAEMLGPELKAECTICIEDVTVGDEVIVLPCKHWFHEECGGLWLKQHNSCPVCRAAIDGAAAGKPRNENTNTQNPAQSSAGSSSQSRSAPAEGRRTNLRQRGEERLESIRNLATTYDRRHITRDSNSPPSQNSSAQRSPRVRSPSPSARGSSHRERSRDHGGSSSSGPFNWIRDRFSGR